MFSITSSEHLIRFASIESPFGFICPQIIKKHLTPSLRGNSETKVYTYDIARWTLELSIQNDNFVSSKRVIDRTSKKVDRFNSCIAQCITPSSVKAFQSESFKLPSYLKPYKISYEQGQKILFFKSPDRNQLFPEEIRIDMKNSQISYISFSKNNKTITNTTAISQQFPTLSQLFKITVYEAEHFYIDEIFKGKLTKLSSFFS